MSLDPGIHENIPAADYHALPYVSSSVLKRLYTSSAKHVHERPVESSEAMDNGTAFHSLLLDTNFHDRYFIKPEKLENWSTKVGKAERAQHELVAALNPNKKPIGAYDMQCMERAVAAFRDHPYGAEIAGRIASKQAKTEVTLIWDEHPDDDSEPPPTFRCKARLDILDPIFSEMIQGSSPREYIIRDPKTTRNANPKKFMWDVLPTREGLNYWLQAAWYYRGARANGLDVSGFEFIAIELERPHGISFNGLDESELDSAQAQVRRLALHWATCQATNQYPGYPVVRNMLALKGDEE